jgi:3-hydroxyacyl-[acyl-carrier-protein] dehydratase
MPAQPLIDFDLLSELNFDRPLYDIAEIRRVNAQRDEMEQLTAIVYVEHEKHSVVGYKDVSDKEFWIGGHMPGYPLMPGVILCEAAAQLASFYARKFDLLGGDYLGFGGMETVRFRAPVYPNCRLLLMAQAARIRPRRRAEFDFQGFVDQTLVFSGRMIGMPIHREQSVK